MRRALWTTEGLDVTEVEPGPLADGWARLRGSEYAAAAQLTGRFATELSAMTTHQFELGQVTEAFETAADKSSGAIKVTILPS